MKKVLSIVLSIVMVLCMMPAMAFADSAAYSDIAGTKCEAAVETLAELGVVDGYPDGTYKPEGVVTRAEMAKLIVTALGLNPTAGTTKFTDMDAAKWAIPYVAYAESLGIIEGYGNGKFGPNDPVTLDQAITMVVRALGYTEDCNEMQGSWPAVYVLKANALGLLDDISTGSAGATRGAVAILLDNALNVPMVYANEEGQTVYKTGSNTMMALLAKGAGNVYGVVDAATVNGATKNIREHLGAAGKIVYNEDGEAISVSDIKTVFLTGKFDAAKTTFKTTDDVSYKVNLSTVKNALDDETGKALATSPATIDVMNNGADGTDITVGAITADTTVTIAATVDGNRITGIFSLQTWTATNKTKVKKADIDQITINKTLLGEKFALDKNDAIDTDAFLLKGVNSLADIVADNIVAVYKDARNITKIEVGTKVVTGEVTKTAGSKYYIDGTAYELATGAVIDDAIVLVPGNKVTVYLDYAGKIFDGKLVDGTAGNYAVVLSTSGTPAKGALASEAKVQYFTVDGEKIMVVDGPDFVDNGNVWVTTPGSIVKYSVNDEGKLDDVTTTSSVTASGLVSKQGLFANKKIADNALIISAPTSGSAFKYDDASKLSVVKKDALLGKTIALADYVTNNDGEIICMIIADSITASDAEYGIVTSVATLANSKKEVGFFINTSKVDNGTTKDNVSKTSQGGLKKITKDATGLYKFEDVTALSRIATKAAISGGFVTNLTATTAEMAGIASGSTKAALYSDVVVYVYDVSDDAFTIGTTSNLLSNDVRVITFYATCEKSKTSADNFGVIDFVVVTKA